LQDTPKFTKIGIFGLKICHLATLLAKPSHARRNGSMLAEIKLQDSSVHGNVGETTQKHFYQ
jgi:hypothetical protein